jgi:hypothetical protein
MASTLEAFLLRFGLASAAEKLKLLGAIKRSLGALCSCDRVGLA